MKALHVVSWILLVVGGLNWGIYGIFGRDVVSYLGTTVATIVYVLVGLSALVAIFTHKKDCKCCAVSSSQPM